MSASRFVMACDLGQLDYRPAWALQQRIQQRLIAAKRRTPPEILPHVLLFVEHPPVFTIGKSGNRQNLLVSEALLRQRGAEFIEIDRGGDITWHGPGQIVGYPILDLDRFAPDIHRYLRLIEQMIMNVCASYGVRGGRIAGRTGVWVDADATTTPQSAAARKICAMGIRCSRWVTMHGFALNVHPDLNWFSHIVPCGIADANVTSLEKETGGPVASQKTKEKIVHQFANLFEAEVRHVSGVVAGEFLADFLDE